MKKPNKYQVVGAAVIALGLGAAGAGVIHAANTSTTGQSDPMSSLVTAIAQKFNLNTADVQKVFDDQKSQMDAQREQDFETRVNQGVKDGKITQAQADLIIAKAKELEADRQANEASMAGKTQAERDAAMKTQMDALKQWATQNNIPQEFIPMGMGHGPGGHGPGGPGRPDSQAAQSGTTSTNN